MHEASGPLEILSDLHYLIRLSCDDAKEVVKYLEEAENQVVRLVQIATRLNRAYMVATKDAEREAPESVI